MVELFPGATCPKEGIHSPVHPPRWYTGTFPPSQPMMTMEISITCLMLQSKQSQLLITAASGQRWRGWPLITEGAGKHTWILLPLAKVVCSVLLLTPKFQLEQWQSSGYRREKHLQQVSVLENVCVETLLSNCSHAWRCCSLYSYRN